MLLLSGIAHGEEAQPPVLGEEVVAVSAGDRVQFDGMLFPTELAIRLGLRVESLEARLRLDVDREQALCRVRIEFEQRTTTLERERRNFETQQYTSRITDQAAQIQQLSRPTPWYRSFGFSFGLGIFASILLVAGGVAVILAAI